MTRRPTYEELEKEIRELKKESTFGVVINPTRCARCQTCQLVCSFFFTGIFNPLQAHVELNDLEGPKFKDTCLHCKLCAKHCPYGALSLGKGEA